MSNNFLDRLKSQIEARAEQEFDYYKSVYTVIKAQPNVKSAEAVESIFNYIMEGTTLLYNEFIEKAKKDLAKRFEDEAFKKELVKMLNGSAKIDVEMPGQDKEVKDE